MAIIEQQVVEALNKFEVLLESTLTGLRRLFFQNMYRARQLTHEQAIAASGVVNGTIVVPPATRNTVVITNIKVNLDPVATLGIITLGKTILTFVPPASGVFSLTNENMQLQPNDLRQLSWTGTPTYARMYLDGWQVGDQGSIE